MHTAQPSPSQCGHPVPNLHPIRALDESPQTPRLPQNESDLLSCSLLGILGAMQSSSAFHGMWSMISAEGIFSFPMVPSRMARTLRSEAGRLHPFWADEMEPVGQSYICCPKEDSLAACPLSSLEI